MDQTIELITRIPGLTLIEEALPKPIQKVIPEWWRSLKTQHTEVHLEGTRFGNAKVCPSFPEYFSKGFVIPMWVDSFLRVSDVPGEEPRWEWTTANNQFSWQTHSGDQYLDHVDHRYLGNPSYIIFKITAPWYVFTPPGWSTYQLPMFYEFNQDFSAVPGVRATDSFHEMSIQIVLHTKNKEVFIPRGTPLAHFVPFKREDLTLDVRSATKQDEERIAGFELDMYTKFSPLEAYKEKKRLNK